MDFYVNEKSARGASQIWMNPTHGGKGIGDCSNQAIITMYMVVYRTWQQNRGTSISSVERTNLPPAMVVELLLIKSLVLVQIYLNYDSDLKSNQDWL